MIISKEFWKENQNVLRNIFFRTCRLHPYLKLEATKKFLGIFIDMARKGTLEQSHSGI